MNNEEMIKLKADIKKELLDYFETLKSEIDIEAYQQNHPIFKTNEQNQQNLTKFYSKLSQPDIIQMQMELVDLIDKTCDTCMNDLNGFFTKNNMDNKSFKLDKEQIKLSSIKNYCIYFKYEEMNDKNFTN